MRRGRRSTRPRGAPARANATELQRAGRHPRSRRSRFRQWCQRTPDDIGEGGAIENIFCGGLDGLPHRSQPASGCVDAVRVLFLHAEPRRDRAFEGEERLTDRDSLRSPRQGVPAVGTALALDEPGSSERGEQLIEVWFGKALAARDLVALYRPLPVVLG